MIGKIRREREFFYVKRSHGPDLSELFAGIDSNGTAFMHLRRYEGNNVTDPDV